MSERLTQLRRDISKKLEKAALPPKILLSRFKTGVAPGGVALFNDPTYLPFYYQLGRHLPETKRLIEFGFSLGMPSGCFLDGCHGVDYFMGFHKKGTDYFSKRLGLANILNIWRKPFVEVWTGQVTDPEFMKSFLLHRWDCVLITDQQEEKTYREYLDLAWSQMNESGLLVMDNISQNQGAYEAYHGFCKVCNREPFVLQTQRGTGLLER